MKRQLHVGVLVVLLVLPLVGCGQSPEDKYRSDIRPVMSQFNSVVQQYDVESKDFFNRSINDQRYITDLNDQDKQIKQLMVSVKNVKVPSGMETANQTLIDSLQDFDGSLLSLRDAWKKKDLTVVGTSELQYQKSMSELVQAGQMIFPPNRQG